MTVSHAVLRSVCLLLAMMMAGCRVSTPLPMPDAARAGLSLTADPLSLVIRPGSSGRVRFTLRDESNQPVAYYPVDFAISSTQGSDTAGAILSTERSLTDASGNAIVEVIVGTLASNDRPADFWVVADCSGESVAQAHVWVTTNAFSVAILPMPAEGLLGYGTVVATLLYFYDNLACADVDLHDIEHSKNQARAPLLVPANEQTVLYGVAASGVHAVAGLGLDSSDIVRVAGCVDVQGSALIDSFPIRVTLLMDHLFPALSGTYQALSDFQLTPAPPDLTSIRSAWQQWARCPLDPARLWLDCTIAALSTETSPAEHGCVPVAGAAGQIGDLLLAKRGTPIAPGSGATGTPADTPCRGATDSNGDPSLEKAVDDLFASKRSQLTATNLGAIPAELAALLGAIHFDSQITLSRANDANSYWVEHEIRNVAFPGLPAPTNSFSAQKLGLPVAAASGILATLRADQLSIPVHAFTLRLGTSARYAFELSSLRSRGTTDVGSLVEAVFGLAQWSGENGLLTGCAALDAVVCEQIAQPGGCVVDACQAGLETLAGILASAFDGLDGDGLDFELAGSAPIILDADGQANALGMPGGTIGVAAGPGLWSASIRARSGLYVAYGSWSALRASGSQ